MNDYVAFLESKRLAVQDAGFEVDPKSLPKKLYPVQRDIVARALKVGRFAIFAACGTGKTPMQLAWADAVAKHAGGLVLILAPLAVAAQTVREGKKFGLQVHHSRDGKDLPEAGIVITNYERLHYFEALLPKLAGVVLDESSILKSYMGKTKRALIDAFAATPYRLACTATPAPNDLLEIGNHAEFLSVMESNEMIARWFINDAMEAGNYRLKRHAADDFWNWVASWACAYERPSDLGYEDGAFKLPALDVVQHIVDAPVEAEGELFPTAAPSSTKMHGELRQTAEARAAKVAALLAEEPEEPWIVWCYTNYEADALLAAIPDAVEVRGDHNEDLKEQRLIDFSEGRIRVLVTKPTIAGFGLNWQHCARVAFVGLSYSFESFYQAIRRTWRFGQERKVLAHVVMAEGEASIVARVFEKQEEHEDMARELKEASRKSLKSDLAGALKGLPEIECAEGPKWRLYRGDCVTGIRAKVADDSVGFSVFSPPFSNLYIYSDSIADMGNTSDDAEFFRQFDFLIPELLRVTIPGRLCAVHCKDLPTYMGRDGAAGLKDFPGEIVRRFEAAGWQYHSRITVWKDPVIEMQRTKNHGLLYKELCKDSSVSRQGMCDYVVVFRKFLPAGSKYPDPVTRGGERFERYLGTNPPYGGAPSGACFKNPHPPGSDEYRKWSIEVWQRYASPVWFDIQQTNVLNKSLGRADKDEKHICPLQLDLISRCIELWTNEGDTVLTPFLGIGSEVYQAVLMGRFGIGFELKDSYFNEAKKNVALAYEESRQGSLFENLV